MRDGELHDRIRLTGIRATGFHGVFEHERREGQTFVADLVLHVDTRAAAAEDRLDLTVHYGVLAEQVAGVLAGEPADLVETVAERIAAVALTHAPVAAVEVVVHKPEAPVPVPFADVAVEIRRDREHRPVLSAPPVAVAPSALHGPDPTGHPTIGRTGTVPTGSAAPYGEPPVTGEAVSVAQLVVPALVPDLPDGPEPTYAEPTYAEPTYAEERPEALEPADRLDVAPDEPVDVVLALGSNVGASQDTLRRAVHDLAAVPGLEITAVSPLARTAAVGGPDQPDYLNAVLLGRTSLAARALLHACQQVEQAHGRERDERWGPRTLDVDVVLHGQTVAATDDLELPHPRAHQRAFVLEPWAQVDPGAVLPGLGGGPVAALAQTAPDRDGIRWMALDWWQVEGVP